jgi:hypothetical protein
MTSESFAKFNMWQTGGSVPAAECLKSQGNKNPIREAQPIQMRPSSQAALEIMTVEGVSALSSGRKRPPDH